MYIARVRHERKRYRHECLADGNSGGQALYIFGMSRGWGVLLYKFCKPTLHMYLSSDCERMGVGSSDFVRVPVGGVAPTC